MKIAILGCGPAGLMAAHAAVLEGHEVTVISKRRKSEMFGAQYLHKPIPGLPDVSDGIVTYLLQGGTHEEYRLKVYGHEFGGKVSTEEFGEPHDAWDIRDTYGLLWDLHFARIRPAEWNRHNKHVLTEQIVVNHDLVISSLPRTVLCFNSDHKFLSKTIWAVGDAPERGVFTPFKVGNMTVVCNATPETGWYRASTIFGYSTVEWARTKKPPIEGVSPVVKPLTTDCDCWPMIKHVGRYGRWEKGVLSHSAFFDTREQLGKGVSIQ